MSVEEREQPLKTSVEVYDPNKVKWDDIKDRIDEIGDANLSPEELAADEENDAFSDETLRAVFENPETVAVLLRDEMGRIIGYSFTILDENYPNEKTAYIYDTEIDAQFQGRG